LCHGKRQEEVFGGFEKNTSDPKYQGCSGNRDLAGGSEKKEKQERRLTMKQWKKVITLCLVMGVVMALALPLWAEEVEKININKASVEELTQLKGVGHRYAERIVQYRQEHGPFTCVEDMMKVQGIGPKMCETNRDTITVE